MSSSAGWCSRTRSCASRPDRALLRELVRRAARAVRLEVAAAGARALAREPVDDDHHVPELCVRTEEPAAGDDAAADAGAQREQEQVAHSAPRAEPVLCERGATRIVLDLDRQADAVVHPVAERNVAQRDVHRAERHPALVVDPRRDAEADSRDAVLRQRENALGELSSSAVCEVVTVGRSTVSCTWPSESTIPARIFVPPMSTPMTRLVLICGG